MVAKTGVEAVPVTVSIDRRNLEASQQRQIRSLRERLYLYLRAHRGSAEAQQWQDNLDKVLTSAEGSTYEDVIRHVEWTLSLYLKAVEQDLRLIVQHAST